MKISDIAKRLPDIELRELRKFVYGVVKKGKLATEGSRTNRTYCLIKTPWFVMVKFTGFERLKMHI